MASAIIPMSFDDEVTSQDGCSIACMATPWLASVGQPPTAIKPTEQGRSVMNSVKQSTLQ